MRPSFGRDQAHSEQTRVRPELAAALASVMKAADSIKAAEARAEQAEQDAAQIAEEGCAYLEAAETRIADLEDGARAAESRRAEAEAEAEARIRSAEAQTHAAHDAWRALEERMAVVVQDLEDSRRLVVELTDRVFAAETRAVEAQEDLRYLESQIREQFGIRGRAA